MEHKSMHVVLIEDDPDDAFLISKMLEQDVRDPYLFCVHAAHDLEGGLSILRKEKADILLLDLFLPDGEGLHTLETIKQYAPEVPVIIVTALDDETPAVEAVSQGAQDYLVKGQISRCSLIRSMRHAIERQRIRLELNQANARLQQLALVDPLTELLNRRGLQQFLTSQVKRSRLEESGVSALLVDLDDFKPVNDMFGHAVGDVVLREIAHRLKSSIRAVDAAARVGGDEFMVVLPRTNMAEGARMAEKVRFSISGLPVILASGKAVQVTASLGLTPVSEDIVCVDELLTECYAMLHKSKALGKNRVSFEDKGFGGNGTFVHKPGMVVEQLRSAHSFHTVKQPIVRLSDMHLAGYEFLSRSNIEGLEMPEDFFRICLEKNILPWVDHTCFKTAVAQAATHIRPGVRCHLNLFPSTIIDMPVQELLDELPACRNQGSYCIEISEQQIIGTPSYLSDQVHALKQAGVSVAIDDIGFGRSYLESLILLEPDIVKVDKNCVQGAARDPARLRSLKRILDVAKVLQAEVIAEGIESKEDLEILTDLGVPYGQGFYISQPI